MLRIIVVKIYLKNLIFEKKSHLRRTYAYFKTLHWGPFEMGIRVDLKFFCGYFGWGAVCRLAKRQKKCRHIGNA